MFDFVRINYNYIIINMIKNFIQSIVVLDSIRSTFNVGSIFRTADALGIKEIILGGTTPAPIDRFGRERKDISKVSLGAEKNISWQYQENVLPLLKKLKKAGYKIIAIEQSSKSIDYKTIKISSANKKEEIKIVFIIGAEVDGIAKPILKLADYIAEIPMLGEKESLNVSVAFGVALFRILNV